MNYLAIGTLNPWIEIWDLDIVDTLEPEFILAPEKIKKKSKVKSYLVYFFHLFLNSKFILENSR